MTTLSREDFNQFVSLLSGLEAFRSETSRACLVDEVLAGLTRENDIRGLLDLSGSPRPAAVSLIRAFMNFGQVEEGQDLLTLLATTLLDGYVFDPEPADF